MHDLETVFQRIAEINHWGNAESLSGDGSTLEYTYNLRHELAKFLRAFGIESMCDAPCGDFNWMRAVDFPENFAYIGGEIVPGARRGEQGEIRDARRDDSNSWTSPRIHSPTPISGSVATVCFICRPRRSSTR